MAKVEGEVVDSFLYKESQPSKQHYYYIHVPMKNYEQQPYLIVPLFSNPRRLRKCISCKCYCTGFLICLLVLFLLLIAGGSILWPSQPKLDVVQIQLNHLDIAESKDAIIFVDTSLGLKVKIENPNLIAHKYNLISVLIGYKGTWLGSTTTNAAFVNARGVSYLEATIKLNGTEALKSSLEQYNSITEWFVPLEILVEVGEEFQFFSINIPIQGRIYCSINVDATNQIIASQNCYTD